MFLRLAEQYRSLGRDLVLSLQALADCLQKRGQVATCYVCGDGEFNQGASFVADLGDAHTVRFLVSDYGISWVECRDGLELVKLEGAEAIHELQRIAITLQSAPPAEGAAMEPSHAEQSGIPAQSAPVQAAPVSSQGRRRASRLSRAA